MSDVLTDVKIWNVDDILDKKEKVRSVEVHNALADTGAFLLCLHQKHVDILGLKFLQKKKMITTNGPVERSIYGFARVEIAGRNGDFIVSIVPDNVPVLVGHSIMEFLDLIPDTSKGKLIYNPRNGDEHYINLL